MKRILTTISLSFFFIAAIAQFTNSNLPILIIRTDGYVSIPDDPRVLATMKIIDKGLGNRNYLSDTTNILALNYNGRIDIEVRGASSQALSKKQYGLSTKKSDNISNNNVSLLGMPSENDWILNGLAFDPSYMRDYIAYNLDRKIGNYATRTVYCEVVINGNYEGLYILQEKVKAGKNRVDINKIAPIDISGADLTGGYITKVDRETVQDPAAFYNSSYYGFDDVAFMHEVPKTIDAQAAQTAYLRDDIFGQLLTTSSSNNTSLISGYPSIIDIPSFVDFMLINELGSNVDAYQLSTYFHKDKNAKLRAGPTWDHNLTFGNDLTFWGYDRSKTDVWQFYNSDNIGSRFWKDLYDNTTFKCYLSKRLTELTLPAKPFSQTYTDSLINATYSYISEAVARDKAYWSIGGNHLTEVNGIKTFISDRIIWMKAELGSSSGCNTIVTPSLVITKIMYNPKTSISYPISDDQEYIEIKNTGVSTIDLTGIYFRNTGVVYQFPPNTTLAANTTIQIAGNATVFQSRYGIAPFGEFTRSLSNTSENLVLADAFGNSIDEVRYYSSSPWPNVSANDYYLRLKDTQFDNNIAASWEAATDQVTSIDENFASNSKVSISPNPASNRATITTLKTISEIQVWNSQGKLIQSTKAYGTSSELDISALIEGLYSIKVITLDESFIQKLIKE